MESKPRIMNRILLIVTLFFAVTFSLMAQPKIGTITGTIIDKSNSQPLENADVTLLKMKDSSVVKGTSTDASGKFSLTELPPGRFMLRANVVGYNFSMVSGITINKDNPIVNLDPIKLSQGETSTDEIVVEDVKPDIEVHPDKKVFNVEKNLVNQGGTLIDLLKNIPGVNVDQDGNVSFRGGEGVKILIDGKNSGLEGPNRNNILEQIPATNVSSIELMSNPSAKYEAEGSYGILNIVLKKDKGFGYNGTVGVNVGTGDKYNGQMSFNLKNNKLNLFGSYNYNQMNFTMSGFSDRNNFGSSISAINQDNTGNWRNKGHMLKFGFDYTVDPMNSFGATLNYRNSDRSRNNQSQVQEFDPSNNLVSDYNDIVAGLEKGNDLDINANYMLKFKKPQQLLTAELSFSRSKENETNNIYTIPNIPVITNPDKRNEYQGETDMDFFGQADYVQPFSKEAKLETGYKGSYKKRDNDDHTDLFNYTTGEFETSTSSLNHFVYQEQVQALYAIYSNKIGNFGFSLGARMEYTRIKGEQLTINQTFTKDYVDFFPSASISQTISKGTELQLSYSRRINRPRLGQLNPFRETSFGSTINISQGNPDLNPEFTDSYEFSVVQYLPWATITPSIFYKYTKDDISRQRTLIDSVTTLTTFVNYNKVKSYGGEMIVNLTPVKIWNFNGTFSYYKTDVDATNLSTGLTNSGYSWSTRLMSNLTLPADFFLQLSYFYSGKHITAQGTFQPFQSFDAAIKKDLFDKKFSITLRANDIFDNAKMRMEFYDPAFTEIFERKRDSRALSLNVTYNFGQKDENRMDKRKKKKTDDNNNNGDDEEGF
jgi:outer membrane receptor protein involved in Fe transport